MSIREKFSHFLSLTDVGSHNPSPWRPSVLAGTPLDADAQRPHGFKMRILERSFHTFIRNVSFSSPTEAFLKLRNDYVLLTSIVYCQCQYRNSNGLNILSLIFQFQQRIRSENRRGKAKGMKYGWEGLQFDKKKEFLL